MAPKHLIDLDIAKRISSGDADNTERFVLLHYVPLCRFMRHLTGHAEDAEDLTQQAFIKAKQQIASYRGKASLRTWLYRIALHEFTHWKRKRRKTQSLDSVPPRVEPAYNACLEAEALLDAIRKLPDSLQATWLLFEVQELSLEEVAKVLRIPQGTVKSRLYNARRKLSLMLDGQQENEIETQPIFES